MIKLLIWGLVAYYLVTGFYIALTPFDFYQNAPGASATGPYNMHFIRDVGFAFITSSLAIAYGLHRNIGILTVFGALWLLIHGLFHLSLWLLHGMHFNQAAVVDLVLVTLPAIAVFALCTRFQAAQTEAAP